MSDWRKRLYDNYVTSGQAQLNGGDAHTRYRAIEHFGRRIIRRYVPEDRGIKVLDLGCGAGGFLYWLKQAGYKNVIGVDQSLQMVEAANRAGVREVCLGDIHEYLESVPEGSIDVVIIIDVLEHLERQQLFDTVDLIYRCLKPGGRMIGHVPNSEGIFGSRIRWGDMTHELSFTQTSVRQVLTTIGFTSIECYEDKPVPKGLRSAVRAVLWSFCTFWYRLLHAVETGVFGVILSQNLLFVADK